MKFILIRLTGTEIDEVLSALGLRKRTAGEGTASHDRCAAIEARINEAAAMAPSEPKIAGVDSRSWKEY
jgi:hypothetical protein